MLGVVLGAPSGLVDLAVGFLDRLAHFLGHQIAQLFHVIPHVLGDGAQHVGPLGKRGLPPTFKRRLGA